MEKEEVTILLEKADIPTYGFWDLWLRRIFCKHEFVAHKLSKKLNPDQQHLTYITCRKGCTKQYIMRGQPTKQ